MKLIKITFLAVLATIIYACSKEVKEPVFLDSIKFDTEIDGKKVGLFTLKSGNGIFMQVTNFGGRVVALWTPDKDGNLEDIVLGHKTLEEYVNYEGERYIGCVVGRYANRIAKGQFAIDSVSYQVPVNNNGQSLHGGTKGLDLVVWDVEQVADNEISLSYISNDGDDGYPGNLKIKMIYTLTKDNEFKISYSATTDKPTVVNLSHHGFFNLLGEGKGTINDHVLVINADSITPIDEVLIPTGKLMAVKNSPFDFNDPTAIGNRIDVDNEQLKFGKGYDHNWVLNRKQPNDVVFAASVYEPTTGRYLEVWTDQPGIQFYSGNFFNGEGKGKYGSTFNFREALALETQKFPDSPNHPNFPSTRLNPNEEYKQICIYKFSVK